MISPIFSNGKFDLHLHSKYSNHPSEWFLKKLGTAESYTEIEDIYKIAKDRGMDYVTITDHNNIEGALKLKKMYPDDCFISVESTVYFPEDDGKVHILIYDITEKQFEKIQTYRKDIYKLRDYIRENNIAYSVAHATYSVNGTLKTEHLEKLLLLFDVFEIINGGRGQRSNSDWEDFLKTLTKADIEYLEEKHKIKPFGEYSWIKGFTGGSDDHAGIFIGKTYTLSKVESMKEFIESIKGRKTVSEGRHNNFQGLAFAIYKIAYDFAKQKSGNISGGFFDKINENIFENKKMGIKDFFKLKKLKNEKKKGKKIKGLIGELLEEIKKEKDTEKKLDIVYEKVTQITDEALILLIESIKKDIEKGNIYNLVRDVASSLPGIFLCVPFISTFRHMFNNRNIVEELKTNLNKTQVEKSKKILWFTDTIEDMNGVSVTLKKIGWESYNRGKKLGIAVCVDKDSLYELPPNIINLDCIAKEKLPYYEEYEIKIPSLLNSLEKIYEFDPDEIYISTPGTIGLIGLLAAKLLNLKCTGVYHTDFTMQSKEIADNASLAVMLESYLKWFYSMNNDIKVPTKEYIDILYERGYERKKLKVFKRGIEIDKFYPENDKKIKKDTIDFIYTGRISKDKNIEFLIEVFIKLSEKHKNIKLNIVGKGPDFKELKKKYDNLKILNFTGKVEYENIPKMYRNADIFLFPSITDTFGMSVLEAQACGLPAIVSDKGGPKEIIVDGETGFIAKALDEKEWINKIEQMIQIKEKETEKYEYMIKKSTDNIKENFLWDNVIKDIFGII